MIPALTKYKDSLAAYSTIVIVPITIVGILISLYFSVMILAISVNPKQFKNPDTPQRIILAIFSPMTQELENIRQKLTFSSLPNESRITKSHCQIVLEQHRALITGDYSTYIDRKKADQTLKTACVDEYRNRYKDIDAGRVAYMTSDISERIVITEILKSF